MSHTQELLKILEDTTKFLQEISVVEEEKFQAAMKNHILVIEDCIKKEQALLLRSKGLELKRTQIQKAMGAEQKTLRQIIETADVADKAPLQAAFLKLEEQLKHYQEVHEKAKTAIEVNLHRINTQLENLTGKTGEGNTAYSDHGQKVQKPHTFTSRKI